MRRYLIRVKRTGTGEITETKGFLFLRANPSGLQINTQWHAHPGYVRCHMEAVLGSMSIGVAKVA